MTVTLTLTAADGATHQVSLPAPSVATSSVAAPAITNVRSASTQNTLFNVANGGNTISNNLNLFGTSNSPNSTLTVFLGGKSVGTTATDSSGNWSYPLGAMADGAYTATAAVSGSAQSSSYAFTIKPGLTSLPVAVGSNIANSSHFNWGADSYEAQHDPNNSNACVVVDTHTLSFTSLSGDIWPAYPTCRTEIESQTTKPDGTTFNITYEYMLAASSPVNNAFLSSGFMTIGQIHDQSGSLPVGYINQNGPQLGSGPGDALEIITPQNGKFASMYRDTANQTRGVWHTMDIICNVNINAATGFVKVFRDGVQLVNKTGIQSGNIVGPYYWKLGVYRTENTGQTQQVTYRNLQVSYS